MIGSPEAACFCFYSDPTKSCFHLCNG